MSDESQFAKGYKYGTYVTKNYDSLLDKMFFTKDLEEFAVKNLKQKIPFTSDERLSAGYDKGVADMNLALRNKPREGEKMTAEQLMAILQNQNPQGAFGNVTNNEQSMFNMMAGNSGAMTDAAMAQARNELNVLKAIGQNRILKDDEKARALYLQDLTAPVELLPVDIDGASAGNALTKEQLDAVLNRIYQMRGGR